MEEGRLDDYVKVMVHQTEVSLVSEERRIWRYGGMQKDETNSEEFPGHWNLSGPPKTSLKWKVLTAISVQMATMSLLVNFPYSFRSLLRVLSIIDRQVSLADVAERVDPFYPDFSPGLDFTFFGMSLGYVGFFVYHHRKQRRNRDNLHSCCSTFWLALVGAAVYHLVFLMYKFHLAPAPWVTLADLKQWYAAGLMVFATCSRISYHLDQRADIPTEDTWLYYVWLISVLKDLEYAVLLWYYQPGFLMLILVGLINNWSTCISYSSVD